MDGQLSLSLVSGPKTPALWSKSLAQVIDEQAAQHGAHTATSFPWQGVCLSYQDLASRSKALAKAMLSCGLQHGDHVAIMAGNCYQYIEAFLGAARIGCPYVVLNNTYSPEELVNALRLTECKVLFVAENIGPKSLSPHYTRVRQELSNLPSLQQVVLLSNQLPSGSREGPLMTYAQFVHGAGSIADAVLQHAATLVQPNDVLNLQFTSGTTGNPKAAMLSHSSLINNGRFVGGQMHLTPEDKVACPPPLFHCFGLVMGFLASFVHGSTIVFPSDQFNADAVLEAVSRDGCTALLGVPTMFVAILEAQQRKRLKVSTVRTGLAAGSSVPAVLMRRMATELGITGVLIAYGMTETSPVTFLTALDDSEEHQVTTVGRVLPHTAAKVVDQHGRILPRGVPGELCTSGYALQRGYWKNQVKTDEVMKRDENGVLWMHTGDECVIDRQGYCTVTGRIKDIIIRGECVRPFKQHGIHHQAGSSRSSSSSSSSSLSFFVPPPCLQISVSTLDCALS